MRDTLRIEETPKGFEITRTLHEVVNEEALQERLRRLQAEREGILDELERLERNIKITENALATGLGEDTL